MLGTKKIKTSKIETLIGQSIEVDGDLSFHGGLHLDGKVNGKVVAESGSKSVLVVSEQGQINGDVSVPCAVINGTIKGNVYASEKLELSSKACITGNVHYNVLEMASGAAVNGNMLHTTAEKPALEHQSTVVAAPDEVTDQEDVDDVVLAKSSL